MQELIIRRLGTTPYATTLTRMRQWTAQRQADTPDECWITDHPPTYTLGQTLKQASFKSEPPAAIRQIEVAQSDRGGKMTYHGPGQIVFYLLLNLRRRNPPLTVKQLVFQSEEFVRLFLAEHGIEATRRAKMPGVYVSNNKIAALGYKVSRGCSYHGLSFNHQMDLTPFDWIDVCGYADLKSVDLASLVSKLPSSEETTDQLLVHLAHVFSCAAVES